MQTQADRAAATQRDTSDALEQDTLELAHKVVLDLDRSPDGNGGLSDSSGTASGHRRIDPIKFDEEPDDQSTQRDAASGMATGKRQHKPHATTDEDAIDSFVFEPNDEPVWTPEIDDEVLVLFATDRTDQASGAGVSPFDTLLLASDITDPGGNHETVDEHEIEYDVVAGV